MKTFQVTIVLERESYNGYSITETHNETIRASTSEVACRKARRFWHKLNCSVRNVICTELEKDKI
jgi:hypothetical protein